MKRFQRFWALSHVGADLALVPAVDKGRRFGALRPASRARMFIDPAQDVRGGGGIVQRAEQVLQFAEPIEERTDGLAGNSGAKNSAV